MVWNMAGLFFHSVGNVMILSDEVIFFRGVGIPPTRLVMISHPMIGVTISIKPVRLGLLHPTYWSYQKTGGCRKFIAPWYLWYPRGSPRGYFILGEWINTKRPCILLLKWLPLILAILAWTMRVDVDVDVVSPQGPFFCLFCLRIGYQKQSIT